jgi:CheY-like chemotaxis protein
LRLLDVLARQAADLIERRAAEDALRESERTLTALNQHLSEAGRRKDEFLAMLGHELRNPLGVITSAVQLMRTRDLRDPVLERALAAAQRQSAHMARLVDELLDVARITEGKVTLTQERLRVADVIDAAMETMRPVVQAAGHRLYRTMPREPLIVVGDPVRLAQVIGNLLNNAAKYTPAGGEIHVAHERRNGEVEIRVRDTGQGIAPGLLPSVFDLFVQGERGADHAQGGLGIGLTVAKRLVEMHGGRIEVTSPGVGQGTEFTITLPLALEFDRKAPMRDGPSAPRRLRRILVVDDNVDGAEVLSLLLQAEGHDVKAAGDGAAALTLAASWKPDVIILDIAMPGMDGYDVAERLRRVQALGPIELVALTGYGQGNDIERSRRGGFDHHLVKPVSIEALRRVLG